MDHRNQSFARAAERQAQRKLRARRCGDTSVYFGLGLFGLVGWSVAVPALAAIALGIWLDSQGLGNRSWSWTLMLLFVGVALGCFNAWYWINRSDIDGADKVYRRESDTQQDKMYRRESDTQQDKMHRRESEMHGDDDDDHDRRD